MDLAGELVEHIIPSPAAKFEKHIKRLKEETWFCELEKDYRYGYIIHQNRRVRRFLCNEKNIKLILSMDEGKERFIELVKEEHARFTKLC